jgi:isopentenyl diphosphate isomerase/L-lactate dehydrogenase-like FMN-dependent dehydrogenase
VSNLPEDLAGFEAAARERVEPFAWEYLARGSGREVTLRENLAAWERWALLPRVLRDVATIDAATAVLGTEVAAPILIAPTAMQRFFCDDGEQATARAAATAKTVFIVSMAAPPSAAVGLAPVSDRSRRRSGFGIRISRRPTTWRRPTSCGSCRTSTRRSPSTISHISASGAGCRWW